MALPPAVPYAAGYDAADYKGSCASPRRYRQRTDPHRPGTGQLPVPGGAVSRLAPGELLGSLQELLHM
jgi:hypothetical protein